MIEASRMLAELEVFQELVFANASWLNALFVAGVVLASLTLLSYRRSAMPLPLKLFGILLRCFGIAILLVCLLEPLGTLERPKPQANIFGILVDTSESMDVLRRDRSPMEQTKIKERLGDEAEWHRKLSDDFRVRRYTFDTSIEPVDTFEGLEYHGHESSLHHALETLRERFRGRPLAGVLLFSDAQATDRASGSEPSMTAHSFSDLGFPVYPVGAGQLSNRRDIRIASVTTRQSHFETAPVTIAASVAHHGFANQKVQVDLIDSDNKTVQSQTVVLKQESEPVNVEFRFRPEKRGVQGYAVLVTQEVVTAAPSKDKNKSTDVALDTELEISKPNDELTMGNNRRFQVVDRGRGPYRLLYIAGRPNWEYKFLKRALDEDDEIQLTSLIRIAKKEPKFSFRDSKVDSANPLFSGFEDISDEEKEKFDEPVFTRMGRASAEELKKGFPKDADELFEYSAIILDDLEHDFFTLEQQSLIRQFVAVRGGGLLALGGQESFRGKGYRNSVFNQILPIYGEDAVAGSGANARDTISTTANLDDASAAQFQLTREGWLQPFLRLAENETAEKDRLAKMPAFGVFNRVKGVKPGASILADTSFEPGENFPILASQRFGKGRTAAFMIGDMWRWGLHHTGPGESPLGQSWRQMIRWLIADVPKTIEMKLKDESGASSKTSIILVDVKGTDFKPIDNAQVNITITAPDGAITTALSEGSSKLAGQYESTMVADQEGVYTATAEVRALDGSVIGTSQLGWVYEPSAKELLEIGDNQTVLRAIAAETGGAIVELDQLDSFVASLPSRKVPMTEKRVFPLWHQSWVLLLSIFCICLEWGMRRRYGMA
jgi:uncharacterized membrane protein